MYCFFPPPFSDPFFWEIATSSQPGVKSKSSKDDILYIEDEKARIKIEFPKEEEQKSGDAKFPFTVEDFVTGVVLAIRGRVLTRGSNMMFWPEDICAAGYPDQKKPFPLASEVKITSLFGKPRHLVALVSGLEVHPEHELYYDKLYSFLAGQFGSVDFMRVRPLLSFFLVPQLRKNYTKN